MGVFADLLTNRKTFKLTDPVARYLQAIINRQLDPANPTVAAATDAVHTLAASTQTSGSATLTFTLRNGETFDVTITFQDAAATVETAIDVAATAASITGWANGDISVSGTAVNDGGLVFTFDGDSVSGINHPVTSLADVDGAGGAWGEITLTTPGQGVRYALGALIALGVLDDGTIPAQTAAVSNSGVVASAQVNKVPQGVVMALAREMAAEDVNQYTYFTVIGSLGIEDKAPRAEPVDGTTVI